MNKDSMTVCLINNNILFSFGSVQSVLDIIFRPNDTGGTDRLIASVRRGQLGRLKINPNAFKVFRLGMIKLKLSSNFFILLYKL